MQLSVGAGGGGAAGQQAGGVSSLLRGQTGTLAGESFWAVTNNYTASNYSYTVESFSKRVAFDCIMSLAFDNNAARELCIAERYSPVC